MTQSTIFRVVPSQDYDLCQPAAGKNFFELDALLNGARRTPSWIPFPMEIVRVDESGRKLIAGDAPWYASRALVFRPSPVIAIGGYLEQFGELLPLKCADADVSIYNVTRVIDALDEENSTLVRFDNGRIMYAKTHAFHADIIRGVDIFKVPKLGSAIYVGEGFVDRWNAHHFRGLSFEPIWSSA
jgi:hypothetical protein